MGKRTLAMRVIPEPAPGSRALLIPQSGAPALRGGGPLTYTCGRCGNTLLKDLMYEQARSYVVRCHKCGAFNEAVADGG